jgi:uncharacterized protein (TIGR00251 family)
VIEIVERAAVVAFAVRVTPRASRDAIEGEWQGALRVRVTAPPVDDRANEALRKLFAERLKIPLAAVRIVAGHHSRVKRVEIEGVGAASIRKLAAVSSK